MTTFLLPSARRALLSTLLVIGVTLPVAGGAAWLAEILLTTAEAPAATPTPTR